MAMRRKILAIPLAGLALAITLNSCAANPSTPSKPKTFGTTGSISVPNSTSYGSDGDPCKGESGFDDIRTGAQVVVKDESDKTISVANLDAGATTTKLYLGNQPACNFKFVLTGLTDAKFYSIHIGNTARGDVQFTKSDMKAGPALSIGGS